jgi:hypothetical protein
VNITPAGLAIALDRARRRIVLTALRQNWPSWRIAGAFDDLSLARRRSYLISRDDVTGHAWRRFCWQTGQPWLVLVYGADPYCYCRWSLPPGKRLPRHAPCRAATDGPRCGRVAALSIQGRAVSRRGRSV